MSVHLKHALYVAASVLVSGAAAWLASDSARSFVDHHAGVAAAFPFVVGLVDVARKHFVSTSGSANGGTP